MSAVISTPSAGIRSHEHRTGTARGRGALNGTGLALRLALRRDRVRLPVWLVAVALVLFGGGQELSRTFSTAAERTARATLMSQPSGVFLGGPGYGLDNYTEGAMMANEYSLFIIIAAAIMAIQLAVRHTRGEESAGRTELLRAGTVGRQAAPAAATIMLVLSAAAMSVVCAVSLLGLGLAAADSWAWGLGIGAQMLVFGAFGLLFAQLASTARAATGLSLAVLAVAAVIRGVGDVIELHGSALSWFSPIAWTQQIRAFVDLRWWPLVLCVGLCAVLLAGAAAVQAARDLDAGVLPQRPGRARARGWVRGPVGLGLRLTRTTVLTWVVALAALAVTYGSLAPSLRDSFAELPPAFQALMGGSEHAVQGFLDLALTMTACGAAALTVSLVSRLHGEETAERTELVLAQPVRRTTWLLSWWLLAVVVSALAMLLATLVLAATAGSSLDEPGLLPPLLGAWVGYLPAMALVASITALGYAVSPQLTPVGWVPVLFVVIVSFLGPLLGLPDWLLRASPFDHVPQLANDDAASVPVLTGLTVAALALVALAAWLFRRRNVPGR